MTADSGTGGGRRLVRIAQLLLVLAALCMWAASRLSWVVLRSFDGLGQPKTTTLIGSTWSTALVPLALVAATAAVAALAVRGWPLRVLAGLVALTSFAMGYLGASLWAMRDVAVRAAALAGVPVVSLVGSERVHWGAAVTLAGAVCTLLASVLLMRAAAAGSPAGAVKYAAPAAARAAAREADNSGAMSERMLWDAIDEGRDPTVPPPAPPSPQSEEDTEGR